MSAAAAAIKHAATKTDAAIDRSVLMRAMSAEMKTVKPNTARIEAGTRSHLKIGAPNTSERFRGGRAWSIAPVPRSKHDAKACGRHDRRVNSQLGNTGLSDG